MQEQFLKRVLLTGLNHIYDILYSSVINWLVFLFYIEEIIVFYPLNVSRETHEKLEIYKNLILKWQKAINLVSRGTLNNIWERHIMDSLQIIPYISGKKVLDIGSGAGFPGMVLAIANNFRVVCVDSDKRKIFFLSEVARITKTDVLLIADRIENLKISDFDVICSRGFSELSNLLKIMNKFPCASSGIFLKGNKLDYEITKAKILFDFKYEIYKSKTDDSGKIIVVHSVKKLCQT